MKLTETYNQTLLLPTSTTISKGQNGAQLGSKESSLGSWNRGSVTLKVTVTYVGVGSMQVEEGGVWVDGKGVEVERKGM